MIHLLRYPFSWIRKHPGCAILIAILLLGIGAWGGAKIWWNREYRFAERAFATDHYSDAETALRRCLRFRSNHVPSLLLLSRVQTAQNDYSASLETLNQAKTVEGEASERIQLEYLFLRAVSGEFDLVESSLHQLIREEHPHRERALETLARAYTSELSYDKATVILNLLITDYPNNARGHELFAWLATMRHAEDLAVSHYEKAIELAPERISTRLKFGQLLLQIGQHERARQVLEQLTILASDNPEVLVNYSMALAHLNEQPQLRLKLLTQAVELNPNYYFALLELGRLEIELEDPVTAEKHLRQAIALHGNEPEPRFLLLSAVRKQPNREADAAIELERYNNCRRDSERFDHITRVELKKNPRNVELMVELGEILIRSKVDHLAIRWLNKALSVDPYHVEAHSLLHDIFTAAGNEELAAPHAQYLPGRKSRQSGK